MNLQHADYKSAALPLSYIGTSLQVANNSSRAKKNPTFKRRFIVRFKKRLLWRPLFFCTNSKRLRSKYNKRIWYLRSTVSITCKSYFLQVFLRNTGACSFKPSKINMPTPKRHQNNNQFFIVINIL